MSGCAEVCFHAFGSRLWIRIGGSTLAHSASQCSQVAPRLQDRVTLCNDLHSGDSGGRISPFPHNAVREVCLV